jgi:protein-disulfide isomerase
MGEAKGLIITGLVTVLILVGGIFLVSKNSNSPASTPKPVNPALLIKADSHQTATASAEVKSLPAGRQVTIVEFGDYQCPACGAAYPATKEVLKNYGDKINFVFRNFPLPQHKNAQISAEAAEAANAQGKFWQMYDKLYETQKDWGESDKPLDKFLVYAKDLGLDVNKFKADVTGNKYKSLIDNDTADGTALNVNATPTFYINGGVLQGVPTYNDFKSILDQILSQK